MKGIKGLHMPHPGEKGFTLIEMLVVVAILGILAAVVVPNVGRWFGTGDAAAQDAELHNVQAGVMSLMADLGIPAITSPVANTSPTSDMGAFPSSAGAPQILYGAAGQPRHVTMATSEWTYWCEADGTVHQVV